MLVVTVTDLEGLPVESARVSALAVGRHGRQTIGSRLGVTGPKGTCEMPYPEVASNSEPFSSVFVERDAFASVTRRFLSTSRSVHVVLTPAARLEVTVMSRSGVRLPGAMVGITDLTDGATERGAWPKEYRTDADGTASIPDLPGAVFAAHARAPGFETGRAVVRGVGGGTTSVEIRLQPARTLRVRVVALGCPVASASVTLAHRQGSDWGPLQGTRYFSFEGLSDGEGVAVFDQVPLSWETLHIVASHQDHGRGVTRFQAAERTHVDVELQAGARARVEVRSANGGAMRCIVKMQERMRRGAGHFQVQKEQGDEPVVFEHLPSDSPLQLSVALNGALVHEQDVGPLAQGEDKAVAIVLPDIHVVEITAHDAEGRPVRGDVRLSADPAADGPHGGRSVHAGTIDTSGRCELWLLARAYDLTFQSEGGQKQQRRVVVPTSESIAVVMDRGVAVSGRVTSTDGAPLPNCIVAWQSSGLAYGMSDHEGRFVIRGAARAPGKLYASFLGVAACVYEGPPPEDAPAFVVPTGRVRGTVVDESSQPVAAFVVAWADSDHSSTVTFDAVRATVAAAGPDGRFELLLPAARWTLWAALADGPAPLVHSVDLRSLAVPADVVLRLNRAR